MKITSTAFSDAGLIPSQYTCDGAGVNPPLEFTDVPAAAKSLVLVFEDPDVPHNFRIDGLFVHWMVWNMPPTTTTIEENSYPEGVAGLNTAGTMGYTPPCPPSGSHRYFVRLYALDTELILPSNASKADVLHSMQHNIIDQAELMGRYERTK